MSLSVQRAVFRPSLQCGDLEACCSQFWASWGSGSKPRMWVLERNSGNMERRASTWGQGSEAGACEEVGRGLCPGFSQPSGHPVSLQLSHLLGRCPWVSRGLTLQDRRGQLVRPFISQLENLRLGHQ